VIFFATPPKDERCKTSLIDRGKNSKLVRYSALFDKRLSNIQDMHNLTQKKTLIKTKVV
jgi:hypothetical protein